MKQRRHARFPGSVAAPGRITSMTNDVPLERLAAAPGIDVPTRLAAGGGRAPRDLLR
jgi:hypothetical protein